MQRDKPLPQFHHPRVPIRWSSIDETSSKFPYRAMLAFTRAGLETASAAQTGEPTQKGNKKCRNLAQPASPITSVSAGRHATGARSGQHPRRYSTHARAPRPDPSRHRKPTPPTDPRAPQEPWPTRQLSDANETESPTVSGVTRPRDLSQFPTSHPPPSARASSFV